MSSNDRFYLADTLTLIISLANKSSKSALIWRLQNGMRWLTYTGSHLDA